MVKERECQAKNSLDKNTHSGYNRVVKGEETPSDMGTQ
jgi:hypothetical protein